MKHSIFLSILVLLITMSLQNSSSPLLFNLTNQSFDIETSKNPKAKWLILFHVPNCAFCKTTLNVIKEEVAPELESDSNVHFGFVDCDVNVWIATRFNITMIPYIIIIQNGKMAEMKDGPSKDALVDFINNVTEEDLKPLPKPYSYFQMLSTLMIELFRVVKENMQSQLDKYNITIFKWENYMTGVLMIFGFVLILVIESMIFSVCCFVKEKAMRKNRVKGAEVTKEYKENASATETDKKGQDEKKGKRETEMNKKEVDEHVKKD